MHFCMMECSFGVIIFLIDNSHLFKAVLRFLFHTWEVMVMIFTNNMGFFLHVCVLMLLAFLQWI